MESSSVENSERLSSDEKKETFSSSNESGKKRKVFFETKSLAEVYVKQGHILVALEIYKRIQKRNPSDGQIEKRITELESHGFAKRNIKSKEQNE